MFRNRTRRPVDRSVDSRRRLRRAAEWAVQPLEGRILFSWTGATSGSTVDASHDYNNPANWANGVIDDSFAGVTFSTSTTLHLSADRIVGAGGLNLGYSGSTSLTFASDSASATRAFTFSGQSVAVGTADSSSAAGPLVAIGPGDTVNLTGPDVLGSAAVAMAGGTLHVLNYGSVPNKLVAVSGTTSTLRVDGGNPTDTGGLAGTGTIQRTGSGSLYMAGNDGGFAGTYVALAGYTRFQAASSGSAAASWVFNGRATLDQGNMAIPFGSLDGIALNGVSNDTLVLGGNNKPSTVTGPLGGALSVDKVGTGTLTLSGSNSYSGTTTVDAGVLQFGGPAVAGGGLTVSAGATADLTAAATVAGPVTLAGTLQVDNGGGTGTTTLAANPSVPAGSTAAIDVTSGTLAVPSGGIAVPSGATLDVDGTGTLLTSTWQFFGGTVHQTAGTVDSASGNMNVGGSAASPGRYDLLGGRLLAADLELGSYGSGTLDQSGGSIGVDGGFSIGFAGSGTFSQTDGTVTCANVNVGFENGSGTISLTGGSLTDSGSVILGQNGGTGHLNLAGAADLMVAGTEFIGDAGTGMVVQAGGTNACEALVDGGAGYCGGTGDYVLSGGTLSANNEVVGYDYSGGGSGTVGTLNQTGGTNAAGQLIVGDGLGTAGTYALQGGTLADAGQVILGREGGTLGSFVQTGGTAASTLLIIGVGGVGAAEVSGGSLTLSGNAYVGYNAAGTLSVSGSGVVTDAAALYVSGDGVDGDPAGTGVVDLSGSGELTTQQTYVGYSGPATFDQTGGVHTTQTLVLNGPGGKYATYSASGTVNAGAIVDVQQPSAGGLAVVDEGSPYTLALSGSSVGNNGITSWQVGWGDGNSQTLSGNPSSADHTYVAGGNSYKILPTANGGGRSYPAGPVSVLVNDVPASVTAPADLSNDVGLPTDLSATFTDPGIGETHTAVVDWGDGLTTPATVTTSGGADAIAAAHAYAVHGNYSALLIVTDSGGAVSTVPFSVAVAYVAPTLSVTAAQTTLAPSGTATLTLHDAGPEAPSAITAWTVNWGDGQTQIVTTPPDTSDTVDAVWTVPHTYADAGSYTATATAADSAGPHAVGTVTFTVASPTPVPAAPTGVSAVPDSGGQVTVGWHDVAGETGFVVQRSPNGSTGWSQVGTTKAGVLTLGDYGLTPGTIYYYRVQATNDGGSSGWSAPRLRDHLCSRNDSDVDAPFGQRPDPHRRRRNGELLRRRHFHHDYHLDGNPERKDLRRRYRSRLRVRTYQSGLVRGDGRGNRCGR